MVSTIRVRLLGGLSVWADGQILLDACVRVNKPWQVFCFLLLNRATPTPAARLINALWAGEELTDPANVLKNTVYALRREFPGDSAVKQSPILFENGGYLCNPAIHYEVDTELFAQAIHGAENLQGDEKLNHLAEAVELYKGELLPSLESEVWVMSPALFYRQLFHSAVTELCGALYVQARFGELLSVATSASRVEPLEEAYYIYIFRALYAMKMYRAIIPAYHKMVRILSEQLGTQPHNEIRGIFSAASEQVDSIEQDIMIIRDELRDVVGENEPVNGPLYCTYDVFKYLYQMLARASERSGSRVVIVLLTLQSQDAAPPVKTLNTVMTQVKKLILGGLLRKSDTMARYSKSQYIIMLSIERPSSVDMVIDRMQKRCEGLLAQSGMVMAFAQTEPDPIG